MAPLLGAEGPGPGSFASHSVPWKLGVPGSPSQSPGVTGLSRLPALAWSVHPNPWINTSQPEA